MGESNKLSSWIPDFIRRGITYPRVKVVEGIVAVPMLVYGILFFAVVIGQLVGLIGGQNKYMPLSFAIGLFFPYIMFPLAVTTIIDVVYQKYIEQGVDTDTDTGPVFRRTLLLFWSIIPIMILGYVIALMEIGVFSTTNYAIPILVFGYIVLIALGTILSVTAIGRATDVVKSYWCSNSP